MLLLPPVALTVLPFLCLSAQDNNDDARIASAGSIASGLIFATGWYLFWGSLLLARTDCIEWDTQIVNCTDPNYPDPNPDHLIAPPGLVSGAYWAPGILSTFGMVGLNVVSWDAMTDEGSLLGGDTSIFAKIWVTVSLIFMFTGLGVAIWCLVTDLQTEHGWHKAGICCFIQNVLILVAGFLFRLVRRSGDNAF